MNESALLLIGALIALVSSVLTALVAHWIRSGSESRRYVREGERWQRLAAPLETLGEISRKFDELKEIDRESVDRITRHEETLSRLADRLGEGLGTVEESTVESTKTIRNLRLTNDELRRAVADLIGIQSQIGEVLLRVGDQLAVVEERLGRERRLMVQVQAVNEAPEASPESEPAAAAVTDDPDAALAEAPRSAEAFGDPPLPEEEEMEAPFFPPEDPVAGGEGEPGEDVGAEDGRLT